FMQTEDGILYRNVTGVQTCALPISSLPIKSVRKSNTIVLRTKNFWVFAFFNALILKYRLINSIKINPTIAKIYCLFIKKLASIGAPPVKDPFEAETILAL